MADNTAQNGTSTIRTNDRSGVQTQVFQMDIALEADNELIGLGSTKSLIGTSGGLTTASTNYSNGDQLGTEISVTSANRTGVGLVIVSAVLVDKAKIVSSADAFLFGAATTPAADNAANSWSDADMLGCLGVLHFQDLITSANNYILQATNVPFAIKPPSGTTVFVDLVARSIAASFFGAAGDLQITLGVAGD